jgi:hypothetical protein
MLTVLVLSLKRAIRRGGDEEPSMNQENAEKAARASDQKIGRSVAFSGKQCWKPALMSLTQKASP